MKRSGFLSLLGIAPLITVVASKIGLPMKAPETRTVVGGNLVMQKVNDSGGRIFVSWNDYDLYYSDMTVERVKGGVVLCKNGEQVDAVWDRLTRARQIGVGYEGDERDGIHTLRNRGLVGNHSVSDGRQE